MSAESAHNSAGWPPVDNLVLASASPRRADLLRAAGFEFEVAPTSCDETWRSGESPVNYVRRIAAQKCAWALRAHTGRPALILTADTTVWIHDDAPPLGKPESKEQARHMLETLSAAGSHQVTTAFATCPTDTPGQLVVESTTTEVQLRPISAVELECYLERAHWADKAGAYGIQDEAAAFVREVRGSYTGVVGLPLAHVIEHLMTHYRTGAIR